MLSKHSHERLDRLRHRAEVLEARIASTPSGRYWKGEASALRWAIDIVESVLSEKESKLEI